MSARLDAYLKGTGESGVCCSCGFEFSGTHEAPTIQRSILGALRPFMKRVNT